MENGSRRISGENRICENEEKELEDLIELNLQFEEESNALEGEDVLIFNTLYFLQHVFISVIPRQLMENIALIFI